MIFNMDNKIVEAAVKTPRVFVEASLGEGDDYNREPGIQLTKEQIISLKKYEALGLSLPIRHPDVVAYLNYGAGDGGAVGLTARDFLRTFTMTYDHAKRWSPLREQIMLTGTDLKIFAGSIIGIGNGIVEVYEDLKASKYLEEHNITTPEEYLKLKDKFPNLPDLELAQGDVPDIRRYLDDMFAKVKNYYEKAEQVRIALDSFGSDMRLKVVPELKLRLKFVSENTYAADIKILQADIDRRSAEIDELNKQYDQLVQEAIKAAASLNIGGLILAIYQGVKAEQVRSKRKKINEEQDAAIKVMASKNQTLSSLNRVRADLQNLNYVAIEAEVATQNLMLVWNALSLYIEASYKEVESVDNAVSLRRFVSHIKSVVEPWETIKVSTDELLKVFRDAEKEYVANNGILQGRVMMFSVRGASHRLKINMIDLSRINYTVQDANTTAQMLVQQYDYLPGTVSAMGSLATSINRATFDLRNVAQTSRIKLQKTAKTLAGYQAELSSPVDVDEVREDMEVELAKAFREISAQSADLKNIQLSLSARYDRDVSKQWVDALEQDRTYAQQLKTAIKEKRVVLKDQMKSVSDTIDSIGQAGVEKIGEEAQLTLDSMNALGMAAPQITVALLAMDTLKKLISGIGDTISYLNMLAGYERLKENASLLEAQYDKYTKDVGQANGKIELVRALDTLDDGRWEYVNEFTNVVAAYQQFSRCFEQDKSLPVEQRADTAITRIPDIIGYLTSIQR